MQRAETTRHPARERDRHVASVESRFGRRRIATGTTGGSEAPEEDRAPLLSPKPRSLTKRHPRRDPRYTTSDVSWGQWRGGAVVDVSGARGRAPRGTHLVLPSQSSSMVFPLCAIKMSISDGRRDSPFGHEPRPSLFVPQRDRSWITGNNPRGRVVVCCLRACTFLLYPLFYRLPVKFSVPRNLRAPLSSLTPARPPSLSRADAIGRAAAAPLRTRGV